jgi:plasmid stability protein
VAQLIVRNLEESVKRRLQRRAHRSGRSLEGEVREILRAAAAGDSNALGAARFGTRFASYFSDIPTDLQSFAWDEPEAPGFE